MDHEIVPADKRQRRLAVGTAVLLTLLGLVALGVLNAHLADIRELAQKDVPAAERKALRLTTIVLCIGGVGLVGMGGWFWTLGRRINRAGRFPPPGTKVVKDTRVRAGAQARTLANLAQVLALLCVVAGTLGMWYVYRLAVAVLR